MHKVLFGLFISLTFLLSIFNNTMAYEKEIKSLSSSMAEDIAKAGKKMIAVVDFTDLQGNVTELGRFLAEEFSVALAGAGKGFEVVDRTHLKSIIAEHKLSSTGVIDPQTARKLGQIAGVDALITGTITPFGDSVRISVKILDTATAKVIGASSGDIAKTKAIEELLARGIETSQLSSSQAPTISYVPSIGSTKSKKVGDMVITVKRITVSKGEVTAALDFLNQSDKELKLKIDYDVNLRDEKGNTFDNRGNTKFLLTSKSKNDVVLDFRPKDRDINLKDIGSTFDLSFQYDLYTSADGKIRMISRNNQVNFTDIKAHKPK